jgi:hypothetical protein
MSFFSLFLIREKRKEDRRKEEDKKGGTRPSSRQI